MSERFDVVVFGPTGVTGREVARYVSHRARELGVSWAAAGRDRGRVTEALSAVGAEPDEVLVVDVDEPDTVEAMVQAARVVINLVGPYARYGGPVYAACARTGTHQLDLTGETDWLRTMIDRHDETAAVSGAKIVASCGFEALPFELAAHHAAAHAHRRSGRAVVSVDVAVSIDNRANLRGATDAVSGGTFTSGLDAFERGAMADADPFELDPPGSGATGRYSFLPRRHAGTAQWLAPVFPSPVLNPPIVHRGVALRRREGDPTFAPDFRYTEGTVASSLVPLPGGRVLGPGVAASMAAMQTSMTLAGRAPASVRRAMAGLGRRLGPAAGEGPRPETLDDWSYRIDARAETTDGTTADVRVDGDGHPGYKSTATIVGEAGLILADGQAPVPESVGIVTPATALGLDVLGRFARAGLRFAVTG
ncbi:MAG: saccharopine dehydrogenase NADP-binding domain-containing protein [Actinomycetota bacterium]